MRWSGQSEEGKTNPSGCNDGVNLGTTVDAQNGDLAILAEFRRGVGMPFHFLVDLGACFEKTSVC